MSTTNVMLEAFMQLSSARQEVISKNISSVNSPGVLAQDIAMPQDFPALLRSTSMNSQIQVNVTNSKHLSGSKPKIRYRTNIDKDGEMKPNGNNINLSDQAAKASENQMKYETALKAYQNSSSLTKTALGRSGK